MTSNMMNKIIPAVLIYKEGGSAFFSYRFTAGFADSPISTLFSAILAVSKL